MYTLLFQHNIETFVIEFQIKFDMLFKGINIEYIATYPVVMKYHPVPSRRGNGPITHGVSFLNLEFILPHKNKNKMRIKTFLKIIYRSFQFDSFIAFTSYCLNRTNVFYDYIYLGI